MQFAHLCATVWIVADTSHTSQTPTELTVRSAGEADWPAMALVGALVWFGLGVMRRHRRRAARREGRRD